MMRLTRLEWAVTQGIYIWWTIIHIVLMIWATAEVKASEGSASTVLRVFMLVYALIIFASDITVRIVRQLPNEAQAKRCVRGSRKRYEKCDEGILEKIKSKLLNCVSLAVLFKLLFSILASAVLVLKITNLDIRGPVWIKGFFLLFGWLMLLFPLTSFSPMYKLISVLEYIVMKDMLPWIVIYITISIGFATAIALHFDELSSSNSCEDLTRFLNRTGHTLFELVIMTSGLDTDLKHVRSLACIFEDNKKSVFVKLFLITLYAVISAVVLLSMLIAIMSNTVTEAQQDKGWRQYQVSYFSSYLNVVCRPFECNRSLIWSLLNTLIMIKN